MNDSYRICTRCVMDTSDPRITFDSQGVCNHCREAQIAWNQLPRGATSEQKLTELVKQIKLEGCGREYDCVVGLSGGVDSTYIAYRAMKLGLRCLAVHFDSGWNSELAVKNIEQTVKLLVIDLHTYVCNWDEMRDLQLSFFKASLANCDIPQDHAIVAALYRVASKHGVRTILTGSNVATESILPLAWGYNSLDLGHIRSVQKRFGSVPLRDYPTLGFFKYYFWYPKVRRIRMVKFLNFIDYNRKRALTALQGELGWRYYGGKHYESIFTRFFQGYYLPLKFGYDKRRAHLSSLIVAEELTREAALDALQKNAYHEKLAQDDTVFVAKKLGLEMSEFERLLNAPKKSFRDYPNQEWLFKLKDLFKRFFAKDSNIR